MKKLMTVVVLLFISLLMGCTDTDNSNNQDQMSDNKALTDIDISKYQKWVISIHQYTMYVLNGDSPFSNNAYERFQNLSIDECNEYYNDNIFIIEYQNEYYHYRDAIELGILSYEAAIRSNIGWECSMIEFNQLKGKDCNQYDITNDIGTLEDPKSIAKLGDYNIYQTRLTCMMVVGNIIVDGYYFGFFNTGCASDLDNIGYYAEMDGITYGLQELVNDEILTVKEVYDMYLCISFGCDEE